MAYINVREELPGIRGLMAFRPETARPMNDLVETLLHAPHPLTPGERELIATYEKDVATVLGQLSPVTSETALELLQLPDRIRGYGPVKEKAAEQASKRREQLLADLANPPPAPRQMAAE